MQQFRTVSCLYSSIWKVTFAKVNIVNIDIYKEINVSLKVNISREV